VRHVRSVALSRHTAPDFVLLHGLEVIQLRKLGDLSFRLFVELSAMCDFATGRVETTYAVLLGLLDFDQSHCGGPRVPAPTFKRVRDALRELHELRLVFLDRIANEKRQGLFLRVPARLASVRPAKVRAGVRARSKNGAKQATAPLSNGHAPESGQRLGQGVQEKNSPPSPSLSTASRAAVRAQLDAVKQQLTTRRGKPSK
jgi:hypothetical protein